MSGNCNTKCILLYKTKGIKSFLNSHFINFYCLKTKHDRLEFSLKAKYIVTYLSCSWHSHRKLTLIQWLIFFVLCNVIFNVFLVNLQVSTTDLLVCLDLFVKISIFPDSDYSSMSHSMCLFTMSQNKTKTKANKEGIEDRPTDQPTYNNNLYCRSVFCAFFIDISL